MNKLTAALQRIALDKRLHLAAGALVCLVVALAWRAWGPGPEHAVAAGLVAGVLAGLAKEAYDARHPQTHTDDLDDAVATAAGAVVMAVLLRALGQA